VGKPVAPLSLRRCSFAAAALAIVLAGAVACSPRGVSNDAYDEGITTVLAEVRGIT
jgi:hypothetical protein